MINAKKILATGAAGDLGRQAVRDLIDEDMQVIGGATRPDDMEG